MIEIDSKTKTGQKNAKDSAYNKLHKRKISIPFTKKRIVAGTEVTKFSFAALRKSLTGVYGFP